MKIPTFRRGIVAATIAAIACAPVAAEDIDLFTGTNSKADNPNIVILIDNSANWDAASQHWPGGLKQGQSEMRALSRVLGEVKADTINLGLMLFTPGVGTTPDGAYVRFHVSNLGATEKTRFEELIGLRYNTAAGSFTDICNNGTNLLSLNANCIFQNFSSPNEKVGSAKTDYSAGLFEVFKYFGGFTDPAHAINVGLPGYAGESPKDASHFGAFRYARNGGAIEPNYDRRAYDAGTTRYNSPINADGSNSCAKNYLIFIGNGFPTQDSATTLMSGVNGNTTQLKMPQFTSVTNNVTTTLTTLAACKTNAECLTIAAATYPGYDSYTCTGGTATPDTTLGTDTTCESASACATRAQTAFPGHTSYYCTGGTTPAPVTATSLRCETPANCAANGSAVLPGYTGYSCTGGTTTLGLVNLGTDPVTESVAACKLRAATMFPGWTTYTCIGGSGTAVVTTTVGTDSSCETAANCVLGAPTLFPGHDTYACSGGSNCGGAKRLGQTVQATDTPKTGMTMQGTGCSGTLRYNQVVNATSSCLNNQTMKSTDTCVTNQVIKGINAVTSVTETGTFDTPTSATARNADEWAKYLYLTDTNGVQGQQNVYTYTIDVYKDAQDSRESALLFSMAKYGGGRYFKASDENAILAALREILTEIQSVNTVFASASLPINATNRSQNENQVFIGMFRPDAKGQPRWYGNLKHYQAALFSGDARLADKDGKEAISATTGFIQACATSFYTTDSDVKDPVTGAITHYWEFSPQSAGACTTVANSAFNDLPDGNIVEKGGAGEVLRKGNSGTATSPYTVSRNMLTCGAAPCTSLSTFDTGSVTMARTGAADTTQNDRIVAFTKGTDVGDDNKNAVTNEPRPGIHGDIAHSRPLPVNFGGSRAVEVFYGSNDGAFHAMRGSDGVELWSFIAPEHHAKLKRLYDNDPIISYPNLPSGSISLPKDYFFDGSAGLYQNADNSKVWIFPTERRGGRMIYAFDISTAGTPILKWAKGCPNMTDDTGCTAGMDGIGQTWSVPNAAFVRGYNSGADPILIVGGGLDRCEDSDNSVTTCTSASKGHKVYILNAATGAVLQTLDTDGSVPADITLIDRDFDGKVDHAYVVDTRGALYRVDFVDPANVATAKPAGSWTITKIAQTTGGSRKFLFAPAALSTGPVTYLSFGSGDRERPLIDNYPYATPVTNRFYMFEDKFGVTGLPINLDGGSMSDFSASTSCSTTLDSSKTGWFMDLSAGRGEQTVTASVIFGGTIFFSTNRPIKSDPNSCDTNLGEARGYAVNLLNASGVIGTGKLCGGDRSGKFTGGGLPPSPVVGTVPVKQPDGSTRPISVLIGGINLDTGTGSPIGLQQPPVPISQIRQRVYWYKQGDQ